MGGVRKHLSVCLILLAAAGAICAPRAGQAWPGTPRDQVQVFATCTGRLSALMEHQWLIDAAASDDTARRRAAMIDLLDAAMEMDGTPGHVVLSWRIDAKMAQAQLLQQALFGTDPRLAARAQVMAARYMHDCSTLLLG